MEYYSSDKINNENAQINIIISGRSDGKSYDIKTKRGIYHYLETKEALMDGVASHMATGKRFILLRRKKDEISNDDIELYFSDLDIKKITKGEYDLISSFRRAIYFCKVDEETGKTKYIEKIGYARSLSTEQNTAGHQYPDVDTIIFEEFMSRDVYLRNEPDKLFNFYCTVDRKKGTTKMWLLGNNISRVCPYLREWGLMSVIRHQKQGEISVFYKDAGIDKETGKAVKVKVAVELGADLGRTSFTFGENAEMMNSGKWQTATQPHLPKSYKCYNMKYRIVFKFKGFQFFGEFLQDKKTRDFCWFIRPKNTEKIKRKTLVISDEINISKYYQRNIYDITIDNERLQAILNTFREGIIFYCNDLTGTDFKQAIDFEIRR